MMKINSFAGFSLIKLATAILKFLRVRILITCYTIAFIGSAASGTVNVKTALIIMVLAVWYLHAATANDYADRFIDKINLKDARDRPLVTKDISYKQLWVLHYAAGTLALLFSYFYGAKAVALTAGILLLDYAYSFKPVHISGRGILSQLFLPIAYVYFPFTLGYWASLPNHGYPWLLSIGLYIGFVSRLLLKDFRDIKGDKKFGKNTFLLRHGAKTTTLLSGICGVTALAILVVVIKFSPGALLVIIAVQSQAFVALYKLSQAKTIKQQVYFVNHLARLGNISVLTILTFYMMRNQSGLSSVAVNVVPAVVGTALILLVNFNYNKVTAAFKPQYL